MNPTPSLLRTALAAVALALAATSASAQEGPREPRTFTPPPPSATSTGVPAPAAGTRAAEAKELCEPPMLRGCRLETHDALHPDQIALVGLEQTDKRYRSDLDLKRTPLAAKPTKSEGDLHARQLAAYSGSVVTSHLPEVAPKLNVRATLVADASGLASESGPWWALTVVGSIVSSVLLVRRKLTRRS